MGHMRPRDHLGRFRADTGSSLADFAKAQLLTGGVIAGTTALNYLGESVRDWWTRPSNSSTAVPALEKMAFRKRYGRKGATQRRRVYRRRRIVSRRKGRVGGRKGRGGVLWRRNLIRRATRMKRTINSNVYKTVRERVDLGDVTLTNLGLSNTLSKFFVLGPFGGVETAKYMSLFEEYKCSNVQIVLEPQFNQEQCIDMTLSPGGGNPMLGAIVPITGEDAYANIPNWYKLEAVTGVRFFPLSPQKKRQMAFNMPMPFIHEKKTYQDPNQNGAAPFVIDTPKALPWMDISDPTHPAIAQFAIYHPRLNAVPPRPFVFNVSAYVTTKFRGQKTEDQ